MTCCESRYKCLGYTQPSGQRSDSLSSSVRRSSTYENDDDDSNSPSRTTLDSQFSPLIEARRSDNNDQARNSRTQRQNYVESTASLPQATPFGRNRDTDQPSYYPNPPSDYTSVGISSARDADAYFRDFGTTTTEPASRQSLSQMNHQRRSTTSFGTTSFAGNSPTSNPTAAASNQTPFTRDAH
jgi:hypothetical protein